jgi:hypothetical protein
LRLPNFRQISFNQYIIEADLGVTWQFFQLFLFYW